MFLKFLLFTTILFYFGCKSSEINKERIVLIMPLVHFDSSIEIYSQDFTVTKANDIILYELPFRESLENEDSIIYDSLKHEFFLFSKNKDSGILFRNLRDTAAKKIPVDSILRSRAFYKFSFDTLLVLKKYPFHVRKINDNEICIHYPKNDYDSINIFLDKRLKKLDYVFSSKIDSTYNSKLYKIEVWQKNTYDKGGNGSLKTVFEIKEEKISKPKELLDFIKKAQKKFLQ